MDTGPSSVSHLLRLVEEIEVASDQVSPAFDIDLSGVEVVSRGAALLLTAQIERSWTRSPRCLNGYSPESVEASDRLNALGFYDHLGFVVPSHLLRPDLKDAITVVSGTGVTADLSNRLEEVAAVARPLFGDDIFVSHIHEALSEAMANIMGHAYIKGIEAGAITGESLTNRLMPPTLEVLALQARAAALQRWWIAGHADADTGEMSLYALDHGHTIPVIAPYRMREAIDAYWLANPDRRPKRPYFPTDSELLEAVARARREGFGTGRRGKGFPSMIGLVENEATAGAVTVISGNAMYEFRMDKHANLLSERSYPLSKRLNGTLIEWRIGGSLGRGDWKFDA